MQKKNIYIVTGLVLLLIVLASSYFIFSKENLKPVAKNSSADTILLGNNKSLKLLTDANGMTLYHDIQDWPKQTKAPYSPYSKCTGECSVTWPPFYADSIKISAPLKTEDFTVFTRTDGKKQLAYRG